MKNYQPFETYVMRTPYLPLGYIDKFRDVEEFDIEGLLQLLDKDRFLNFIFKASPVLYSRLNQFCQNTSNISEKDRRRLFKTVLKYAYRMATRATPFGAFAGLSTGHLSQVTSIAVTPTQQHREFNRLDSDVSFRLLDLLKKSRFFSENVAYVPNETIYRLGGEIKFIEYHATNGIRSHHISSVEADVNLEKILKRLKTSPASYFQLLSELSDEFSIEDKMHYIDALIESQIILSELEISITGEEPILQLISKLKQNHILLGNQQIRAVLQKIEQLAELLTKNFLSTNDLKHIQSELEELLQEQTKNSILQTDLFLDTKENTLNQRFVYDLGRRLSRLFAFSRKQNQRLDTFRSKFVEKFEQSEVPLSLALDSELGIGYGRLNAYSTGYAPLISDLHLSDRPDGHELSLDMEIARLQCKLYERAICKNKFSVEVTDEDLEEINATSQNDLEDPKQFYVMGEIYDLVNNPVFCLKLFGGTSGAELLGRFCSGNREIFELTKKIIREEERNLESDEVFAEIVHMFHPRLTNIVQRPLLREYEVPYVGRSGAPTEHQILIEDLLISVKNNKVVLRSKTLGKKIIPRLTTAHNFESSTLPIYQFLCDLQSQSVISDVSWSWGAHSFSSFLPRITYNNIVLSRATWNIDVKVIVGGKKSLEEVSASIDDLKKNFNLPRFFVIPVSDNELLIDLTSKGSRLLFADHLFNSTAKYIQLKEFLVGDKLDNETFKHEFILAYHLKAPAERITKSTHKIPLSVSKRTFQPGDEWLYIKIYTGFSLAEKLLTEILYPFIKELSESKTISKWFFIRYSDPEYHLRLRFHVTGATERFSLIIKTLRDLLDPYVQEGTVKKVIYDTYQRELERYGGEAINISETFFHVDSEAVVRALTHLNNYDNKKRIRLLLSLKGTDDLLESFSICEKEKIELVTMWADSYFREFNGDRRLKYDLDQKFSYYKSAINELWLNKELGPLATQHHLLDILEERKTMIRLLNEQLFNSERNAGISKQELLSSYTHMFLNRLFDINPRAHELVVYHILKKHYMSLWQRQKKFAP